MAPLINSLFSGIRPLAVSGPEAVSLLGFAEIPRIFARCVEAENVRHRANDGLCPAGAALSNPLRSSLTCGTQCYRMTTATLCESSSPGGFSASRERRESRTRPCRKLRIALTRARSTPTWVAKSSSNGSPGVGRGDRAATRTIILFRRGTTAFFVYGFPKSQRANIDADELKQFREAAKHVLALTNISPSF